MSEPRDYKETLRLPQTDFPMKAGLPTREPETLAMWQKIDLFKTLREQSAGRPKYILHDGPPYANGDIHIGHAMQKITKDIVVRVHQMMGYDAPFVPGWDCHGLPIEWKIEEQYRAKGKKKDDVPAKEFRSECRQFAQKWVDIQSEQFQRLGIIGDWENPYTTMHFAAEATIVSEFQKFIMDGSLYRGSKPVMWSVVEKTALAEAEVEYEEHVSPTIFVKFPVTEASIDHENLFAVIWTTTPWTIPCNRAIAYAKDLPYGIYKTPQGRLILCDHLAEKVMEAAKIEDYSRECDIDLSTINTCAHPLHDHGYTFNVPLLIGDFVTDETGTGLVHIAPGHGQDDFELGRKHNIDVPFMIDEAGVYLDSVPIFAGKRVLYDNGKEGDANGAVIEALENATRLLARGKLRHQYPHSWRSKAPLIFRNTPQWFISMDKTELRKKAMQAISDVEWLPSVGRNRISSMVENRPDWVVSRQRAWGVPLTIFVDKKSGEPLRDDAVNKRICEAIAEQGADAWFETDPQVFLGLDYKASDFEQVFDILDVWFDSGTTHAFVLEQRPELHWPADLYLEGSDQHRGWFQSSLLESCGTRGSAPYKQVLTHGFVMDEKGRKMSKSMGNVVDPLKVIQQSGADIIRLWVMSSDYTEDLRIGQEIIKTNTDAYRKLRNTFRFMLGNLNDYQIDQRVEVKDMPELERYMMHNLLKLDKTIRDHYLRHDFRRVYQTLFNFMTIDLSSFYFDIRKDALYCDPSSSLNRRACLTVLDDMFSCLTAWLAPVLAFTMEEVWQSRFPDPTFSVHMRQFPDTHADWQDDLLAQKWAHIRDIRRVVTGALEIERREKNIGSSLEAAPRVYVGDAAKFSAMDGVDMADVCITSQIELIASSPPEGAFALDDIENVGVIHALASGEKCERSWKILPTVGSVAGYPGLTPRDAEAVREFDKLSHG
jgi:isoleucyl-tRNA synthetase